MIGMDEGDAVALGAEFGQDAIFVLTPTNRRVIGALTERVTGDGMVHRTLTCPRQLINTTLVVEPVTVPAGEDEEADEPHYMVPAVEVTVHTENLQDRRTNSATPRSTTTTSTGPAAAKDCSAPCSAMRTRLRCTGMVKGEWSSAEHGTDRRGRSR